MKEIFTKKERARLQCLQRRADFLEDKILKVQAENIDQRGVDFDKQEASAIRWVTDEVIKARTDVG